MAEKTLSKAGYLRGGRGVGSLIGVLFAPKSGEETREYLTHKVKEGGGYAQKQARELQERAEDFVERGKDAVSAKKDQIATAVNVGRQVYRFEFEQGNDGDRNRRVLEYATGFYET